MGPKFTVRAWAEFAGRGNGGESLTGYEGPSVLRALWYVWRARRVGFACVTLIVRG